MNETNREECAKCAGCGRISNDDNGTPWKYWEELPAKSAFAVAMGWEANCMSRVSRHGSEAEPQNMTRRTRSSLVLRNRKARRERMLRRMAAMRAAKERKRLANPVERVPRMLPHYPLELGLRDTRSGEVAWSATPPTGPGYFWSRSHGGTPVIAWYTDSGVRMSCDQTVIVLDSDEGRDWMATQEIEFWPEPIGFSGMHSVRPEDVRRIL